MLFPHVEIDFDVKRRRILQPELEIMKTDPKSRLNRITSTPKLLAKKLQGLEQDTLDFLGQTKKIRKKHKKQKHKKNN